VSGVRGSFSLADTRSSTPHFIEALQTALYAAGYQGCRTKQVSMTEARVCERACAQAALVKLSARTDSKTAFILKREGSGKHSLWIPFKEIAMGKLAKSALETGDSDTDRDGDQWRDGPSVEESAEDEDGLDLPVDPDEGMPLIPDDERVIDVPS
jgi:hypothetical protein